MSRSLKKGPFIPERLLQKVSRLKVGDKTPVKTWYRDAVISPEMVGFVMGVHNGKTFINVDIREEMVGHRLGEFSPTKKFVKHGGKMQRELEASAAAVNKAPAVAPAAAKKKE
jgi:small subunit ribosomal protein S19